MTTWTVIEPGLFIWTGIGWKMLREPTAVVSHLNLHTSHLSVATRLCLLSCPRSVQPTKNEELKTKNCFNHRGHREGFWLSPE